MNISFTPYILKISNFRTVCKSLKTFIESFLKSSNVSFVRPLKINFQHQIKKIHPKNGVDETCHKKSFYFDAEISLKTFLNSFLFHTPSCASSCHFVLYQLQYIIHKTKFTHHKKTSSHVLEKVRKFSILNVHKSTCVYVYIY